MSVLWVQIVSWHAIRLGSIGGKALCGRRPSITAEVTDTLPAEKSCESCLRILARKVDVDVTDGDVGE